MNQWTKFQFHTSYIYFRQCCATYSAYSTDLESTAQQATDMERQKLECEVADKEQQHLEQRKADVTQKQKEAKQLIAEASDRLARARTSDNKANLLAAQALLQSGNTKLEARKVQEQLESVPPQKKQEAQLSQRDRAAACLNFGKNISAKSLHLTLLYVTSLTSTNHHFTVLWHHLCT